LRLRIMKTFRPNLKPAENALVHVMPTFDPGSLVPKVGFTPAAGKHSPSTRSSLRYWDYIRIVKAGKRFM